MHILICLCILHVPYKYESINVLEHIPKITTKSLAVSLKPGKLI